MNIEKKIGTAVSVLTLFFLIKDFPSPTSSASADNQNIVLSEKKMSGKEEVSSILTAQITDIYTNFSIFQYISSSDLYNVMMAICKVESNFTNVLGTDKTSIGYMQVTLPTAKYILDWPDLTAEQLFIPEINIKTAIVYFLYQIKRYSGNVQSAIIAYHLGSDPYIDSYAFNDLIKYQTEADRYLTIVNKELLTVNS